MNIPALIFVGLITIAILFQLALALGAPWGAYAMGGKFPGRLPARMRGMVVVQALILGVFAAVVVARSGAALQDMHTFSRVAIWLVVGFFVLGSVANLVTPSKQERAVWAPVNIALLVSATLVALSA